MTTPSRSKPHQIISAASTTQNLTIDKESLASWLKDTFESTQLAEGITKQEIESNLCQYILDYDKLTLLCETVVHSVQDKVPALEDCSITGYGKNACLRTTINLNKSVRPSKYEVNNVPEGTSVPANPKDGIKQIKDSLFISREGFRLDGALLLGGLKSIADAVNAAQLDLKKMDPEDRGEIYAVATAAIKKQCAKFGIGIEADGQKMHIDIKYDTLMALLEKHSSSEKGFTVKRGEDGTASILIDYRKIVDIAFEKADKLAAAHRARGGKLELTHDMDEAHITYTAEGLEGFLNAAVNGLTDLAVKQITEHQGHLRETIGTLAKPEDKPSIPRF